MQVGGVGGIRYVSQASRLRGGSADACEELSALMTPFDTSALALRLFDTLGRDLLGESLTDQGWTFGFDRARKRLGVCRPARRQITLSRHLARTLSSAEVEDTIRHEIAHAVDYEQRGRSSHDATWKRIAIRCGAKPQRCFGGDLPIDPELPYVGICPSCGLQTPLYRQPVRALRCQACAQARRPSYLRVTRRSDALVVWPGGGEPGNYGGTTGFRAVCGHCSRVYHRARRGKRETACSDCCTRHARGRFDERFALRFERVGG